MGWLRGLGWLGGLGWFGEKAKGHPKKKERKNLGTTRPALLVKSQDISLDLSFWGKLVRSSSTMISGKEYTRRILNPLARRFTADVDLTLT